MLKHAISISCCLKVALLTLFCITKPRKTLEEDLTHVQKTRTAQLSYSLAIYSYVFKISRPLRDVKFTINLAHRDKLIGRFYYILHGFSNKNLCPPPLNQYYPNPFLIEERRKSENRFFERRNNRGDPRNLCVNTKTRLLTTHSIRLLCHPHPSPYFWTSTAPLVQIYFSPQPSAAVKIKEGSYDICCEIIELSPDKITPALQPMPCSVRN